MLPINKNRNHSQIQRVTKESEKVMRDVLQKFGEEQERCIHVPSQPQAGKTDTYLLIASTMAHMDMVNQIVIVSACADCLLREQLKDSIKRFINRTYRLYLEESEHSIDGDEIYCVIDKLEKMITVVWGTQLKKHNKDNKEYQNTLYIIDESHFGQTKDMMLDSCFERMKIYLNGSGDTLQKNNNYLLTISATGFSEITNILLDNSKFKKIVTLEPGAGYYGIEQMYHADKIKPFKLEDFKHILSQYIRYNLYLIVRARKQTPEMVQIIKDNFPTMLIKYCDSIASRDAEDTILNLDELRTAPNQLTVIFIKDRFRMGQRLHKDYICCCIETSKSPKTDTIVQGLLGRMCGYSCHDATVYISQKVFQSGQIEKYINLSKGDWSNIPDKAMNMEPNSSSSCSSSSSSGYKTDTWSKKQKGGNPIIPIKITKEQMGITNIYKVNREQIITHVKNCFTNNTFQNNNIDNNHIIIEKIKKLLYIKANISYVNDKNTSYKNAPSNLSTAFTNKSWGKLKGPGSSNNVRAHGGQVKIFYFQQDYLDKEINKGDVFVYTTIQDEHTDINMDMDADADMDIDRELLRIPRTNQKETYSRKPEAEPEVKSTSVVEVCSIVDIIDLC